MLLLPKVVVGFFSVAEERTAGEYIDKRYLNQGVKEKMGSVELLVSSSFTDEYLSTILALLPACPTECADYLIRN